MIIRSSASPVSSFEFQVSSHSPDGTSALGQKFGKLIHTATTIALTGDLGTGKTVFVQGLAGGLSVPDGYYITSPTYTLINEYPGRLPLYHADLYRIDSMGGIENIGLLEILGGDNVVAIEWAERMKEDLPLEHLAVEFEFKDTKSRNITFTSYGHSGADLLKKLQKCAE